MNFAQLVQLGHLIEHHRGWFEDLLTMNACDCRGNPATSCIYRDAYPSEHALVRNVLELLDGRDLASVAA